MTLETALIEIAICLATTVVGGIVVGLYLPSIRDYLDKKKGVQQKRHEMRMELAKRLAANPWNTCILQVNNIEARLRFYECLATAVMLFLLPGVLFLLLTLILACCYLWYWSAIAGVITLFLIYRGYRIEWKALDLRQDIELFDDVKARADKLPNTLPQPTETQSTPTILPPR